MVKGGDNIKIRNGYAGQLARIDLSKGKAKAEKVEEGTYKKFLGGAGLAAKILYEELEKDVNPLGPENKIVFGIGPFQGNNILSSGRWTVCSKSPLTGTWSDSSGGGHSPWYLKTSGFDGIVVGGRSHSPVYLHLHDGKVEIKDSGDWWG